MKKATYLLWLLGLACIALIATTYLSSALVTSASEPPPTSTPGRPQGGDVIRQFLLSANSAAPVPSAPLRAGPDHPGVRAWADRVREGGKGAAEVDQPLDPSQGETILVGSTYARVYDHTRGDDDGMSPESRNLSALPAHLEDIAAAPGLLATTQLIQNSGFETGMTPWNVWSDGTILPTRVTDYKYLGTYALRMGNELGVAARSYVDKDEALQAITVPAGPLSSVVLEFQFRVNTTETYANYDFLCMRIWNMPEGSAAYSVCLDLANKGVANWAKLTWTLTEAQRAYVAGRSMATGFHVYNDNTLMSTVWIDEVKVTVNTGATPTNTPTPVPTATATPVTTQGCVDLLNNSRLDVTEFGDGTGTIDFWQILWQKVYYTTDAGYSVSPPYSLLMVDEPLSPGDDTEVVSSTLDIDEFAQAFTAPQNLTSLRVSYSRRYVNANTGDLAMTFLMTVDSEGYLDELVKNPILIGDSPAEWTNRFWEMTRATDAATLAKISGGNLALLVAMQSNRAAPSEIIYLDDIQVTACYERPSGTVYMPTLLRSYRINTAPVCVDTEPDNVTSRGYTDLSAVCNGTFSQVDQRDYYTLNLVPGVNRVRIKLYDLPSGTEWDALLYQDTTGYPLICQIGVPGSGDKQKDCNVSPNNRYFVIVNAGRAPEAGKNTYHLSVTPQ